MAKIVYTDNRDMSCTTLTIDIGDDSATGTTSLITVEIDPVDAFRNMIQNLPSPLDERLEWLLSVMVKQIVADAEKSNG